MTTAVTSKNSEEPDSPLVDVPELRVLYASSLIANGRFNEAEAVLRENGVDPASVVEMDLLARIAISNGRFDLAESLWKLVLENDPNHEPAKKALESLAKPWLLFGLVRRISLLAGIAVVVLLTTVGLFSLFFNFHFFNPEENSSQVILKVVRTPATAAIGMRDSSGIAKPPQQSPASSPPEIQPVSDAQLKFAVPGCSVISSQNETRIIFKEGLFAYLSVLKETADGRLADLASALKDRTSKEWILIEGHTDSDPMRGNRLHQDNYSLGLSRAQAVAEILRSKHNLPAISLLVASSGEHDPPFPGDARTSKPKNRTVVIRLLPFTRVEIDSISAENSATLDADGFDLEIEFFVKNLFLLKAWR